jgi:hypothetical protein
MNNIGQLTLKAEFGRKFAKTFRKTLPLDYKKGDKHIHKNTHAIPLEVKDRLMKSKKGGNIEKIK